MKLLSQRFACLLAAAGFVLALAACSPTVDPPAGADTSPLKDARDTPEPASHSASLSSRVAEGSQFVAVTANPHASQAARRVLQEGGTAIDAAIAAQMVLGLVEPQSSGVGGGGFLLYWSAEEQQLYSYDGRETAPQAVDEQLFMHAAGQPMSMFEAIVGGRSVGVPGLVKMLAMAHREHGALPWAGLFDDATQLAEQGFEVSPRLQAMVQYVPGLQVRPDISAYLFPEGERLRAGEQLQNTAYAEVMKQLASGGEQAFYSGQLARDLVSAVNTDINPGQLSLADLKNYRAKKRAPLCKVVFGYRLCGMAPPSSGGATVLAILAQLESLLEHDLLQRGETVYKNADTAHAFIESTRLAFADRNTYLADPDFVQVPVAQLLDDNYLQERASLIESAERVNSYSAGEVSVAVSRVPGESLSLPSTTHLSIVDASGNIASMTTSIETAFGSRLLSNGFLLNNQLTDFSFAPIGEDGDKVANRVQGGKRPLSSMSPMIIFNRANEPVMVVGSPGGKSIIPYVARVIYDHIVGGDDLAEAVAAGHVVDTGRLRIEEGIDESLLEALREKGHQPKVSRLSSGIHALHRSASGWVGVADHRREGLVAAQ